MCASALVAPFFAQARAEHRPVPVAAVAAAQSSSSPTAAPVASTGNTSAPTGSGLTRADLIGLVQPAVVRIVSHFIGTTTVPGFSLDLNTLKWQVDTSTSTPMPYDEYALGSGFIVNSNGYIVTSSHVVSSAELLSSLTTDLASQVVYNEDFGGSYSSQQTAKLDALSSADYSALIDQGAKFIGQFVSVAPPTVVVLKAGAPLPATSTPVSVIQQQQGQQGSYGLIDSLMKSGIGAQIVSVNDNYLNDEKDVALLKVPETGLPTIHLAGANTTHEGDQIFVISFPGSGDLTGFSVNPSFTSGTVSAFKSSTQHTFSYLQTDADISSGSSGSPMLNANGEAVGVTTLSVASQSGGTAFAFGIPITLVDQMLSENGVSNTTANDYASYLRAGLALEAARHCIAANREFALAEQANATFYSPASFVGSHIQACDALIASGKSIDSWFGYARSWFATLSVEFWILFVLAAALICGLGTGIFVLARHVRKDEALLRALEKQGQQEAARLQTIGAQESIPLPRTDELPAQVAKSTAPPALNHSSSIASEEQPSVVEPQRPAHSLNVLIPKPSEELLLPAPPAPKPDA